MALAHRDMCLTTTSFSSLSLSYNGGKDCLVLLILYLSTLYTHFKRPSKSGANSINTTSPSRTSFPTSIPSIYAQSPDPFPSMDKFVTTSSKRYHLDLCTIRTNPRPGHHHQHQLHRHDPPTSAISLPNSNPKSPPPQTHPNPETRITIRDAFATYLSPNPPPPPSSSPNQNEPPTHPEIKAIFVGTRRTDPHGSNLTHSDRTDHGWPDFMRIHPVIDWRLGEIWFFLRADELSEPDTSPLAYCDMYDEGYTSLGGVGDTVRNPRLRYVDEEGRESYRPAYELTEDGDERLGRE